MLSTPFAGTCLDSQRRDDFHFLLIYINELLLDISRNSWNWLQHSLNEKLPFHTTGTDC